MAKHYPLGPRTLHRLQSVPPAGGTHLWLTQVAGGVRDLLEPDRAFRFLRRVCNDLVRHRRIPDREIAAAIAYVYKTSPGYHSKPLEWPAPDPERIQDCVRTQTPAFDPESDPWLRTQDVLPTLFHPGELVCSGPATEVALVRPLEYTIQDAHWQQFIVPNPMRGTTATTQDGRLSPRCQNNVLVRRHLVAEFDKISKPAQVAVISRLAVTHHLSLVVDSGGKSFHAWFKVDHLPYRDQLRLFAAACLMGADPSRWDPCGWVRMPGGLRRQDGAPTNRQHILYFQP